MSRGRNLRTGSGTIFDPAEVEHPSAPLSTGCTHGLEFPHFEVRDSFSNAPIVTKNPAVSAKNVGSCIKCRLVSYKFRLFPRTSCHLFLCFHTHLGFGREIIYFLVALRHFSPSARTLEPSLRRMICPVFSASVWALVLSSRSPGGGAAFPPLPPY